MSADAWRRSLAAGFIGTGAMATTTLLQRAASSRMGPLDFDDSRITVQLAERWTPLDVHGTAEGVVNQLMRFGYGLRPPHGAGAPVMSGLLHPSGTSSEGLPR